MKTYYAETKVRWSDLDANMHLANSSFMNFTSFARVELLRKCGITLIDFAKYQFGPAVLREEFSFFKEAHEGQEIMISVAVSGNSEDGEIFEFEHNLYDKKTGTHLAYSRVLGVWFSTKERKKMAPPQEMKEKLEVYLDRENMKVLSMRDLKELPAHPQNIDPKNF
ncbi:MAG: thioesterase family protein [Weeksellaceae bacterium]